jgi:probable F420-dependent oxidoreductase
MQIKLDASLRAVPLTEIDAHARRYEDAGFDGLFVTESHNNPFLQVALAATTTDRLELGTAVALAFVRSPMDVAYTAWDLQMLSEGRFVLGLGTQVRAHIQRRFGSVWARPAARMAEYIDALRAIWTAWETGEDLDFKGEFFEHTLMPPNFRPPEQPHGAPKIFLADVRDRMIRVAGEHADGLMVHPFHTPRYLEESILPAALGGLERSGRGRGDFEVAASVFIATTDAEWAAVRRRIAFYGSTPGYEGVFETHGWGDLHEKLHRLSRTDGWSRMPALVGDDVVDAFAVRAPSGEAINQQLLRRYDGLVDRIILTGGTQSNYAGWAEIAAASVS